MRLDSSAIRASNASWLIGMMRLLPTLLTWIRTKMLAPGNGLGNAD
jgi:hypothetical protein